MLSATRSLNDLNISGTMLSPKALDDILEALLSNSILTQVSRVVMLVLYLLGIGLSGYINFQALIEEASSSLATDEAQRVPGVQETLF